jgi:hypothetical protein
MLTKFLLEVRHLRLILRREGEAEVVAVVLAALGESLAWRHQVETAARRPRPKVDRPLLPPSICSA